MTTSNLVHFPRSANAFLTRVRPALLGLSDSSEMMLYLQKQLPTINPHLGPITFDTVCDENKELFTVYVLGSYPGMPLTFRSRCLKSCYLHCAQHLCALTAPRTNERHTIRGIAPIYVRPLPEFKAAR